MSWHEFIFSKKATYRIRRHLIFWLLWWIYFAATYYYYVQVGLQKIEFGDLSHILVIKTFLLIVIHILACYSFIYFLFPRYFLRARYFEFSVGIALLIGFLLFAGYYVHSIVFPFIDKAYNQKLAATNTIWWTSINAVLLNAPKIIAAATAITLVKRWYLKQKEKEKLEREKLTTDLQLLKAQIRPGFLFTSLDHIHEYARNKSPKAQELLLKFSDLLSYLLYECDEAKVPLEKELSMMRDYMYMEKIRYGKSMEMEIQVKGDTNHKSIAPLLLLPFIENSFRLCAGSEQSWINIGINVEESMLTMRLMNGVDPDSLDQSTESTDIVNAQKRLDLLYPDSYELKMHADQEIYVTLLRINLNNKPELQTAFQGSTFNNQKSQPWYAVN